MENHINVTASNMSELTHNAFIYCLFKEGEDLNDHIQVEGITNVFYFHPKRLEEKRELVKALLLELPEEFKEGYSFLTLCTTRDGELWTGDQTVCEELVVLSIALGLMSYCLRKEMWHLFPGGVPYVIIK